MSESDQPVLVRGQRVDVEIDGADTPDGPGREAAARVATAVIDVIEAESELAGLVELAFVDRPAITELNEAHLGGTGATDVLSFPLDTEPDPDDPFAGLDDDRPVLGSIVICDDVVVTQATDHVGDPEGERLLMGVHAALHLLGHDHAEADERAVMQALEARHLAPHGVTHPGDQVS